MIHGLLPWEGHQRGHVAALVQGINSLGRCMRTQQRHNKARAPAPSGQRRWCPASLALSASHNIPKRSWVSILIEGRRLNRYLFLHGWLSLP